MNRVCLIGCLTSKPELRYTTSNIACTNITIAIDRNYGEEKKADFINFVVWRKQAENVCKYLDKGSLVAIEGRLQQNSYEDRDGNRRYKLDVFADNIQFLNTKSKNTKPVVEEKKVEEDPFSDFGQQISIDDDLLD